MRTEEMNVLLKDPLLRAVAKGKEVFWLNPERRSAAAALREVSLTEKDVSEAERLLRRFAPVILRYFPETAPTGGIIESPLTEVPRLKEALCAEGTEIPGRLFVKRDGDLPVAGSVKARGGVYEVLKHAETLALSHGLLSAPDDDHRKLTTPEARAFFSCRQVQVGSTGNLGLSIGIMSAALGFRAIVHMSADAKQWKKDLLRARGAEVIEYQGDYGEAVKNGRARSEADPNSYFVDDENSRDLFCGYATAGERLRAQLDTAGIAVDASHPLFVYLPCGVGGAPGGITFGLKLAFGDAVRCFFAEPTGAPCMLLGLLSGKFHDICVQEVGLDGKTRADGLAVGRCSSFAGEMIRELLEGESTTSDGRLDVCLRRLFDTEGLFVEPSACAAFRPLEDLCATEEGKAYLSGSFSADALSRATHIVWATGGSLVPGEIRKELLRRE